MIKKVACKLCGTKELVWSKMRNKWRLFDDQGNPHFCSKESGTTAKKTQPNTVHKPNDVDRLAELVADLLIRVSELEKKLKIEPEQLGMFEVGSSIPKKRKKK